MKNIHAAVISAAFIAAFISVPVSARGSKDSAAEKPAVQEKEQAAVQPSSGEVVHVGILNGPTSIPVAYMCDKAPDLGGTAVVFDKCASPQALLPRMLKGETDIGFMPANIAAKVYNAASGALLCAGISGNGNLYLITKDRSIGALSDLAGKTVSVAGQGATPEYLLRWLLAKNSIPADREGGVKLDFTVQTPDIAAELIAGKIRYAVVPEPFATVALMKSKEVFRAIDLQQEFQSIEGQKASYPLTVMVVSRTYAESHPDTVRAFQAAFNVSLGWTLEHPQKAGVLVQKNTLGLMAPVVANSIPFCNFVYKDADESRAEIERLLDIFLGFSPESVGGTLPDDGFYFR
jgi:NitT/TauT family transport system substrate-binding protein